jgi:hypothetical protein
MHCTLSSTYYSLETKILPQMDGPRKTKKISGYMALSVEYGRIVTIVSPRADLEIINS